MGTLKVYREILVPEGGTLEVCELDPGVYNPRGVYEEVCMTLEVYVEGRNNLKGGRRPKYP